MKYDFETLVNRKDKYSIKWNAMYAANSNMEADIPPFSVADHDFQYPEQLISKFKAYIDDMIFGYSIPDSKYYSSFINWVNRRYDFKVDPKWILDSDGVVNSIENCINVYTNKGDGVIIMPPVYPAFARTITNQSRELLECNLINDNGNYKIDFKLFEELTKKESSKMFIMCSPHNPVGRVWTKNELLKINQICEKNNVLVISDEIHMDLNLDDHKHLVFLSLGESALNNSILLTSASKTFNLAGTKTSMTIIANEQLREKYTDYTNINKPINLNSFGFKLVEIAYNDCEDWLEEFKAVIKTNYLLLKDFLNTNLDQIKVSPLQSTYLTWLDFSALNLSDDDLFNFLVNDCQIMPNLGKDFGDAGSGFIRLNIAVPTKDLEAALNRLKNQINKM